MVPAGKISRNGRRASPLLRFSTTAQDARAARLLAAEKRVFRDLETDATEAHFGRMRRERTGGRETTTLSLDLVRDLKLVNSHLVAASAYPVLESEGELRGSRLRQDD